MPTLDDLPMDAAPAKNETPDAEAQEHWLEDQSDVEVLAGTAGAPDHADIAPSSDASAQDVGEPVLATDEEFTTEDGTPAAHAEHISAAQPTDDTDPLTRFDLGDALHYQFSPEGEEGPSGATDEATPDSAPALAVVAADEPEFVRRDRQRAFWRSTPMRLVLGLIALLLLAALALQAAWFWRDTIAQRWPQSRPYLDQLCAATTGCRIAAPQDLQALVIDTSSLSPASPQPGLMLHVLLRNQGLEGAVAYPALELTLTDLQGVIRARKVLLPAQYLPSALTTQQALSAGLAAGQQIAVDVHLRVQGDPPAGYRVLAFYP